MSIHKLQKKMCTEDNNSFFWQNDPGQATLITYFRQRLVFDFQVNRSCLLSPINIPLQVHTTVACTKQYYRR